MQKTSALELLLVGVKQLSNMVNNQSATKALLDFAHIHVSTSTVKFVSR